MMDLFDLCQDCGQYVGNETEVTCPYCGHERREDRPRTDKRSMRWQLYYTAAEQKEHLKNKQRLKARKKAEQ